MKNVIFFLLFFVSSHAFAEWSHNITEDKMGRGSDEIASTTSLSYLNLAPPYDGKQNATLSFRRLGKGGNELVLSIQKGQIVCDSSECMVLLRVNSEEPFRFAMSHPKDGSSNILIGALKTEELRKLKSANKITAEVTIYQNGESIVEFDTQNNPFKGRVVYTLDELKEKIRDKKEVPSKKNGEINIGDGGFEICKQVVRKTKNDEGIEFISKSTKDELVSESYSESSKLVTSCKKGMKHMLIEVYEYK